jgi:hypothetical protein
MNHDTLGESIDLQSDAINHCLDAIFDDETGNNDDATGITDDMLQMNKNTFTFLNPVAQKLHQNISNNSPSKLKMHTQNTIQASRKNMVGNIQYIIGHGNIKNNKRVWKLRDELETFIQETKMKVQKET